MWELCFKSPHVLQINLGSFKFEIRTWSVQIDLVDTKGNMDEALLLCLLNIKHLVSFTARCCRSIPFSKRIETAFPSTALVGACLVALPSHWLYQGSFAPRAKGDMQLW